MKILVPQKNIQPLHKKSFLLRGLANLTITLMLFGVVAADVLVSLYQAVYFTISDIPKIPRKQFVVMTRHKLPGLSVLQKWSCWYCEYANGVIAYAKAVTNQTEIYSCAIKYSHQFPGQEYQEQFYEQETFMKKNDAVT